MLQHRNPHDDHEIDRAAFNAAFQELGLRWHWDSQTYDALAAQSCERSRVRAYLETEQAHLLRAYDADFLADAVLVAKQRSRQALAACPPRTLPRFGWADARWGEVGI
jgi:hypothetical protein